MFWDLGGSESFTKSSPKIFVWNELARNVVPVMSSKMYEYGYAGLCSKAQKNSFLACQIYLFTF
jgi:hypothetical protein